MREYALYLLTVSPAMRAPGETMATTELVVTTLRIDSTFRAELRMLVVPLIAGMTWSFPDHLSIHFKLGLLGIGET
jgi:hypothetical protein